MCQAFLLVCLVRIQIYCLPCICSMWNELRCNYRLGSIYPTVKGLMETSALIVTVPLQLGIFTFWKNTPEACAIAFCLDRRNLCWCLLNGYWQTLLLLSELLNNSGPSERSVRYIDNIFGIKLAAKNRTTFELDNLFWAVILEVTGGSIPKLWVVYFFFNGKILFILPVFGCIFMRYNALFG